MQTKNPHAVALGKRGGKARAKKLTKEQRSEIARKASNARKVRRGRFSKLPDPLQHFQ